MSDFGDDRISVFVVRCPLGDQCSKKGGTLAKKLDEESARAALKHHLMQSPYHELSDEDATAFTEGAVVESWTEEKSQWVKYQEEQKDWTASRKRKVDDARAVAVRKATTKPTPIGLASRSSGDIVYARDSGAATAEATIAMNGMQLMACIDSLKRARTAATSAANLAAKASRAFHEEAVVIRQCEDVLKSYLD